MANGDDVQEQVLISEAEIQTNVDAVQAALLRAGRATARVCVEQDSGQIMLCVEHEGWKFKSRADGTKRGMYLAIAPGKPPDSARADEIATLVRERTRAQPGDSLASWEATVLPALRLAMAQHPVLRGATIGLGDEHEPRFAVKLSGDGWQRVATIRRGPLVVDIEEDCERLARAAAGEATRALEAADAAGDMDLRARLLAASAPDGVPLVASSGLSTQEPADVTAHDEPQPNPEVLPRGWTWDGVAQCVAYRVEPKAFAQITPDGKRHRSGKTVPEVWRAVEARARRLGITAEIMHESQPCAAFTEPAPAAKPRRGPPGYLFQVEANRVEVHRSDKSAMPCGAPFQFYYRAAVAATDSYNTDPKRWAGHEEARQWAAHLLDEPALPLREEGTAL